MRVLFATGLALLVAAPALAQTPLFSVLDGSQRAALAPQQSHYYDALQAERGVEAVDLVRADASRLHGKAAVEIALPGRTVTLEAVSSQLRETGYLSWAGRVPGGTAWAVLVARDGQITGEVHAGGYVYPIRPLTGGLHAVARKSMASYQMHEDDYPEFVEEQRALAASLPAPAPEPSAQRVGPGATTVVDVLVPYTTDVGAAFADPFALAQSFVDATNLAYTNSGLDIELNLLYTYETPYTYSGSTGTDLGRIQSTSDGNMDEVHGIRDAYGADLVALISGTHSAGTCGTAYTAPLIASFGFSVSSSSCGALTFVHEVGHNFGAEHDAITDDDPDPTDGVDDPIHAPYARGYVDQAGDWGTVMAYTAACDDDATPGDPPFSALCDIVPYFSNPDVSYTGDVNPPITSGPTGDAATADNARQHEDKMATIAGYRAAKPLPSSSVAPMALNLTVAPGAAVSGLVTLENTAAAGSQPLSWRAALQNLDDATGNPVANACTGTEGISQTQTSFYSTTEDGGAEVGQSFTAPCTGKLTRVTPTLYVDTAPSGTPWAGTSWTATLRIYQGAGTTGSELASVPVSVTNPSSNGSYVINIDLPTPVEITSGGAYTWFLDMTSGKTAYLYSVDDPYAGGNRYRTSNGNPANASIQPSSDLNFSLSIVPPDTWVSLPGTDGSIDPGTAESVVVTFDATGYTAGTYTGDLVLTLNDPSASTVTVPMTMTVAGTPSVALADGFGWRLLAPPTGSMTVASLADQNLVQGVTGSYPSADANLYTGYDGAAWTAAGATSDALPSGRGFAWYLFDQDIDPDTGDPNNSTSVVLPMSIQSSGSEPSGDVPVSVHGAGFDLLGNPYTDVLDVSGVNTWTGSSTLTSFVGQVYRCDANTASPVACEGSYELTTTLSDLVPVWHAVFFEAGTAGTLTIPVSAKGAPATRASAPRLIAFELRPEAGGAVDRAATVLFRDGAQNAWDGWDASKLAPLASPSVTLAFEGERDGETVLKAQESRPLNPDAFEVPLTVGSEGAGDALVLAWPRLDVPEDWTLTLTDRLTGETIDLRTVEQYAFEVAATAGREATRPGATLRTSGAARFALAVQPGKVVSTDDEAESVLALDTPRPNPVASRATVTYSLAEAGRVRLSVVDLLGREVAVLADGPRPAGPAVAEWQTGALASGVYVLRLETEGAVLTRRAVVAR